MSHIPAKYHCLSGSSLKVIALLSMTTDHLAYFVMALSMGLEDYWLYDCLRGVGRLAFPLFAFLVVEGYHHTRNLNKYMVMLLVAAGISDIPWILLGQCDSHNVLFTLLLGLMAIAWADRSGMSRTGIIASTALFSLAAAYLKTDYSWNGVCLMMVFQMFREKPMLAVPFGFPLLMEYGTIGTAGGLLMPLLYSGGRGFIQGRYMKYLFYLYYPLHLMVIWWIQS